MAGYFKRRDCKSRKSGERPCRSYIAISPKGRENYGDIDASGYCAECRKANGLADGQQALSL